MQRLNGKRLNSVEHGEEGQVSLIFGDCMVAAYNPWDSTTPVECLIGRTVERVELERDAALRIEFDSGDIFSISVRAADYVGPEAFQISFAGGPIIVE